MTDPTTTNENSGSNTANPARDLFEHAANAAPCAPKAGVDYCGATHPEYGECFLDVDEVEHEHGHESASGRWSVTVPAVSTDEER